MRLDHITSSGFPGAVLPEDPLAFTTRKTFQTRYVPPPFRFEQSLARPVTLESVAPSPATLHPLPGDHSGVEPPDPIPNSEVKRTRADGSVAQAMQE